MAMTLCAPSDTFIPDHDNGDDHFIPRAKTPITHRRVRTEPVPVVDPHLAWETERQALKPRYAVLKAIPTGELPADYDERFDAIMGEEEALLDKIKTTPARTIEGALCKIEVIDRYELELAGLQDHERKAIDVRAMAVGTIRRCLMTLGVHQVAVDPHHEWIEQYRILEAETDREVGRQHRRCAPSRPGLPGQARRRAQPA